MVKFSCFRQIVKKVTVSSKNNVCISREFVFPESLYATYTLYENLSTYFFLKDMFKVKQKINTMGKGKINSTSNRDSINRNLLKTFM